MQLTGASPQLGNGTYGKEIQENLWVGHGRKRARGLKKIGIISHFRALDCCFMRHSTTVVETCSN